MNSYLIANPPVGIYKGDFPLNYVYVSILLDIRARYKKSKGFEQKLMVICLDCDFDDSEIEIIKLDS